MTIKTLWSWHQTDRQTDRQTNGTEHGVQKEALWLLWHSSILSQDPSMGKGQSLQQMVLKNWIATHKRMKFGPYLVSHIKINSKWFKDLNKRPKTIKLLEENKAKASRHWNCQWFIGYGQTAKAKIGDCIKLKNTCTSKETISRVKSQPMGL